MGTSARGCTASATATLSQYPRLLTMGPSDTTIWLGNAAQIYGAGAVTYSWLPATTLSDATTAMPVATPLVTTLYNLSATDGNQCVEQGSVIVRIRAVPVFQAPPDEGVCKGFAVKLTSKNGSGYVYSWSPTEGLSDPAAPAPYAGPVDSTTYFLHINDSVCHVYDSNFAVQVYVRPSPVLTLSKDNDIDCAVHTAQLHVTGGAFYTWAPVD